MISAQNAANKTMLIVDVSEVKLPGEARQHNLTPECGLGQPIDVGVWGHQLKRKRVDCRCLIS
jgi:hypothetical protein